MAQIYKVVKLKTKYRNQNFVKAGSGLKPNVCNRYKVTG
jgi:hypothetical protein